jgi:hypothetical protein
MKGSHAEQLLAGDGPVVASPFGPLETRTWRWQRRVRDIRQRYALVSDRADLVEQRADLAVDARSLVGGCRDDVAPGMHHRRQGLPRHRALPAPGARLQRPEIGALFDEVGAVGDQSVALPYVTHAYRARRP